MSNAEKFGHTVGRFFKKIDRTLSFLPEKPRKAVVMTAALAVSPLLICIVLAKTKVPENVDYRIEDNNQPRQSLLAGILKDDQFLETNNDGYRDGSEGVGFYIFGTRIDIEDDV